MPRDPLPAPVELLVMHDSRDGHLSPDSSRALAAAHSGRARFIATSGFGHNRVLRSDAVLDVVLAPGFIENVGQIALRLKQSLAELKDKYPDVIAEIRGEGLMLGLKLHTLNTDFVNEARAHGLLVVGAGDNVVRLLPPLIITEAEVAEAVSRLDKTAGAIEAALKRPAAE